MNEDGREYYEKESYLELAQDMPDGTVKIHVRLSHQALWAFLIYQTLIFLILFSQL